MYIIIIFISLLIFAFLHFVLNVFYDGKLYLGVNVVFLEENSVEIFSELYNTDFIVKINNGKMINKKERLDTNKLGEHEYIIKVEDKNKRQKDFSHKYIVKDTIAPVITFKKSVKTTEGVKVDLLKGVTAKDNSKEEIKVTVDGSYDINKIGIYTLYYIAKDGSGNTTKESFQLEVEKKEDESKMPDNTTSSSKGYTVTTKDGKTYINGILIVNKTYSLPSNYNPGLSDTLKEQANKMFADAKNSNFDMYIGSGFRSYNTQKNLYNKYVKQDGKKLADTYSARAGHSEHQSGLAIDVCAKDLITGSKYPCITSSFDNTAPAIWLNDNAHKYGFIIRYPKGKTNETGYKYESWHLRYVGVDLATKLYNNGNWISLENYFGITSTYSN